MRRCYRRATSGHRAVQLPVHDNECIRHHPLASGEGRSALIAVAQNAAGTIFDQKTVRPKAQASVPGDGAAVGLVTLSDESPILAVECRTYGE